MNHKGTIDAPPGYEKLHDEPRLVDDDLNVTPPESVVHLGDLGYQPGFIAQYPNDLAITSPLRVLSESGVNKLAATIDKLRPYAIWGPSHADPGIIRGSVYRSGLLADLVTHPTLLRQLNSLAGVDLMPTPLGHQLGHINLPPRDGSGLVGNWHVDQNSYVLVLFLHDPDTLRGGRFQYFRGTRWDGLERLTANEPSFLTEKVESVSIPAAGWAVFMQGSAIMHRAEPLAAPGNRISVVASYEPVDARYPDQNPPLLVESGYENDPNGSLEERASFGEFARHKAQRCADLVDRLVTEGEWDVDERELEARFLIVAREAIQAAESFRIGKVTPQVAMAHHAAREQQQRQL